MAETALLDPPAEQAPAPSGPSFADLAKRVQKSDAAREAAGAEIDKRAEAKTAALKPAIAASAAREKQIAETPAPPVPELTKPPSRALSEFLSPRENESPHASIMKLISAVGLLATGASGLVRGDARGSLAALTGALSGWHEGDKERADRQFADWQAATDSALKQHKLDVEGWQRWMEQGNLLEGQRMTGLKLKLAESEIPADAAIWKASSASEAVKELDAMLTHQANVQAQRDRIVDARTKATEDRESREKIAADMLGFRRDADEAARDIKQQIVDLRRDSSKDIVKLLPAPVRAELLADPEAGALIAAGQAPTQAQIDKANSAVAQRGVDRARDVGLNAANVAQRTPTESMRRLEDMTVAQSQVNEMGRLASTIRLDKVVGGVRPWFNQIAQTGKVGPFPVTEEMRAALTTDERRFLALTQDYADTILRLRSGAAINESEFKRMLMFIPEQSVTPETFLARLALQADLLGSKKAIVRDYLKEGGYRAPDVTPTPLTPAGTIRIRRKGDTSGKQYEGRGAVPDGYEVVK